MPPGCGPHRGTAAEAEGSSCPCKGRGQESREGCWREGPFPFSGILPSPLPLEERVLSAHPPQMVQGPKQHRRHVRAKPLQSCPTLCDPVDCSPPGSPVHGILQVRILERVAVPSSRGFSPAQGLNPSVVRLLRWSRLGSPRHHRRKNSIPSALCVFYNKQTLPSPCIALTSPSHLKPKHRLCLGK